jgi:hypothetical protein
MATAAVATTVASLGSPVRAPPWAQISGQGGAVSDYRTLPGPATVSGCQVAVPLTAQ